MIIEDQGKEILSLISLATQLHTNIEQNMTTNTSSTFVSIKGLTTESLQNQKAYPIDQAEIHFPSDFILNDETADRIFLRVGERSDVPHPLRCLAFL